MKPMQSMSMTIANDFIDVFSVLQPIVTQSFLNLKQQQKAEINMFLTNRRLPPVILGVLVLPSPCFALVLFSISLFPFLSFSPSVIL